MARRMMLTPGESGEYNAEEINDNGRFVESHREERPSQWVDENTGGIVNRRSMGWNELADQQRANAEMEQINANRKAFDQYVAIEDGAKRQQLALNHQRAIAGAAMIQSAARNGGMSDRSLSAAFSQAFGRPVYGGQLVRGVDIGNGPETVFAMYGAAKDPQTGKATIAPVAMMGSREMLQVLKRAGLGDATNDLQNDIIDNSYIGKWTDDQRAAAGVSRPSAPISTGTTVISGSAMRALRGQGRTRAPISVYSNVGADGRIGSGTTSKTIYPDGTVVDNSTGTNSPDWDGWSKLQFQVGDTQTFKNKFTGEIVNVPKGSSLRAELDGSAARMRGAEKIAQIQAQGRADERAEKRRQYDATLAASREAKREQMRSQFVGNAVQSITRMLKDQGVEDDKIDEMVQQQLSSMLDQYDRAMGGGGSGGVPAPQGDGTIVGAAGGANGSGGKGQATPQGVTTQGQPKPAAEQAAEALRRRGKAVQGGGNSAAPESKARREAPKVEEGSETDLVAKEAARRKAFTGELEEGEDGSVRYKIRNWDYLPEDLKGHIPERGEDLDDLAIDAQNKANAAKKAFDERFNAEVKPGIEADARKKFPNSAAKRRKFVEEEVRKWLVKNDPAEARRHREDAEDARWSALVSD